MNHLSHKKPIPGELYTLRLTKDDYSSSVIAKYKAEIFICDIKENGSCDYEEYSWIEPNEIILFLSNEKIYTSVGWCYKILYKNKVYLTFTHTDFVEVNSS